MTNKSEPKTKVRTVVEMMRFKGLAIDSTIFYTNDLLPSNTTLDLSFERLSAKSSCIKIEDGTVADSVLPLTDVYLQIPFKKDPEMFHLDQQYDFLINLPDWPILIKEVRKSCI